MFAGLVWNWFDTAGLRGWRQQDGSSCQAGVGTHFPHLQELIHSPHKCLNNAREQLPSNLTRESGEMKGIKVKVLREAGKENLIFTSDKINCRNAEAEREFLGLLEGNTEGIFLLPLRVAVGSGSAPFQDWSHVQAHQSHH